MTSNRRPPPPTQREVPQSSSTGPTYIPALDGLRAVSVIMVLVSHMLGGKLVDWMNLGGLGVYIFFVISGYLITTILVNYQESGCGLEAAAVHFYWRRILRLYPALLAAILITAALGIAQMRQHWWVHALYLSNFQVAHSGNWNGAAHFWSLATEEQFYILWFPLVLLTTGRTRFAAILCAFAIGPSYRLALLALGVDAGAAGAGVLLPGKIDPLAIGAILALAARKPQWRPWFDAFHSWRLLGLSTLLIAASLWLPLLWRLQLWSPAADVFACCLVRFALDSELDPRLAWLTWGPVRHVGKISYGLYVYHYFVGDAVRLVTHVPRNSAAHQLIKLVDFAIAFIVAEISWKLLEAPILALKSKPIRVIGYSGRQTCSAPDQTRSRAGT